MFLKGFNCEIEKGKTTAIVGESGSGKTTLASLNPKSLSIKKW